MRIDDESSAMLNELAKLDKEMRDRKLGWMAEARARFEREMEQYTLQKGLLAHRLVARGVPKVQIREVGLHTKDNNTLNALLERTRAVGSIEAEAKAEVEDAARFRWLDGDAGTIRVNWKDAKTYLAHTYAQHVQGERGVRMDPSRHGPDMSGIIKYNPDGNPSYEYVDDDQKTEADESMVKLGYPYSPGPLNTALGDPEFVKAVDEWRTR